MWEHATFIKANAKQGGDELGTFLGISTLKSLVLFGILQGSNRIIKIYYFAVVNYMKIQLRQ